ncbi:hypothetical protein ACFQFQ_18050 [Sulfitobacter porphyrae]|uniref:Uncharacterized protein n=1 Tax=Sulfitobacter porphyrae TaxID=1246864 RepID=A0ABW2B817_9RHOB
MDVNVFAQGGLDFEEWPLRETFRRETRGDERNATHVQVHARHPADGGWDWLHARQI